MFVHVGHGNYVALGKVVCVINPNSSPVRKAIRRAGEEGRLVDATGGRKTRAAVFCSDGSVVLASASSEVLVARAARADGGKGGDCGCARS